ncbi:RNA-binding S4 domain, partial [Dillenia turbinata]
MFIPWIVRDENGNLKLQSTPRARLLHAMADAKTAKTKKKEKTVAIAAEPKHSKAARRFYNENFRDQPQRLSKVLAAAGVASRRNSEELIFEGKVTVNGSFAEPLRVDPARDVIMSVETDFLKSTFVHLGIKSQKSVVSLFDDYLKSGYVLDKKNPRRPKPRLFTVGRLDVVTTGLIIVTNDGMISFEILLKNFHILHLSYLRRKFLFSPSSSCIDSNPSVRGTIIQGIHCTPDSVELLPKQPDIPRPRLRIVVREGRNHEIHSLKRIEVAGSRLPSDLGYGLLWTIRRYTEIYSLIRLCVVVPLLYGGDGKKKTDLIRMGQRHQETLVSRHQKTLREVKTKEKNESTKAML